MDPENRLRSISEQWLQSRNIAVFLIEWNSSDMVKEITSKGKKKGKLTQTTFSLLHATDFADRYERKILPLLRAGILKSLLMWRLKEF
jgi:dTMP kinase